MTTPRDHDAEILDNADRRYAYDFDLDVMDPIQDPIVRAVLPAGQVLELGSYTGSFTSGCCRISTTSPAWRHRRWRSRRHASALGDRVRSSTTHRDGVPAGALRHSRADPRTRAHRRPVGRCADQSRVADRRGRLLLVCPERQRAVAADRRAHGPDLAQRGGHVRRRRSTATGAPTRSTRSNGTRSRAGLRVVHRSGIFFKALANFQWDRLLKTDIISTEYLDGCFELGQRYPDLCSSLFLLCERGDAR